MGAPDDAAAQHPAMVDPDRTDCVDGRSRVADHLALPGGETVMADRYFNHIVGCLEASIKTAEDGVDCRISAVTVQGAVDLLKEQQERIERFQPKWIPVSERLPEEEGGYIAYYSYPDGTGNKFVGPCHYSIIGFDEEWSWTNAYGFKLDVSHWMPFPEQPKEN